MASKVRSWPSAPAVPGANRSLIYTSVCSALSRASSPSMPGIAGTLEFRMAEQQLHYAPIFGPSIDQRFFGAAHRMSAVRARVKADLPNPAVNDSRILSSAQMGRAVDAAREQAVTRMTASSSDPCQQRLPRLLRSFELHRP
jgi:hypothetical protein